MPTLRCWLLAVALALAAAPQAGAAEAFPSKPIRFILGFAPGGSADVVARAIQPHLEKQLGQSVIIEHRTGAGGVIAVDAVAKSPPDGHVIALAGAGALFLNPNATEKMPYDPLKDLAPVSLLAEIPFVLIAPATFEPDSVREVIERAKKSSLSIGHGGNGTAMHLSAQLFSDMAGIAPTLIPYRGSQPVANDVLAGHIPLGVTDITSAIALIQAGQIKALGVSTSRRTSSLPNVPTIAESGLPGYEAVGWFGVIAPAGTVPETVDKLNAAITGALSDAAIKERIVAVGAEPAPMTPERFAAFIRSETEKWNAVIAKSGTKAN
jgi:tripartite-type tricarboxylate transporter receptor subunit TctC